MEIREILLKEQIVPYELHIKNNKRCYLRIKEGKLVITSSPYFSIRDIEQLIYKHQDYILKHIKNYEPQALYQAGGYVYIFNVKYEIILRDMNKRQCGIHGNSIYVYHHNIQDTIERYLKQLLFDYSEEYIFHHQTVVTRIPEITIRKMKSRWGSCFTTKNKISLNLALIHLDKDLIDYVILHELCHFLQANHSPLFYQEIAKHMPDYKQRIQRLKETTI
ncbi:MAG: M48 family metallopeptidase [Coprobacillaceae bacterium]